jgi:hypothetical protein
MGEAKEGPGALWRFGDSPFTWGGVGVIVGSALVSPAWFTFAFIGGGIAIAIGLLRARAFQGRSVICQVTVDILLLSCLGGGWFLLWKVIPKPVEPLTRQDAQDLLSKAANANRPPSVPPGDDAAKPITKAEFTRMLQQYEASRSAQNKFANSTNATVSDMARAIALNMHNFAGNWRGEDNNEYLNTTDSSFGAGGTVEMREAAAKLWAVKKKKLTEQYLIQGRDLIAQANEYRLEMLNRLLPSERNLVQDQTGKAVFEKLLSTNYDGSPEDVDAAAYYLDYLRKKMP